MSTTAPLSAGVVAPLAKDGNYAALTAGVAVAVGVIGNERHSPGHELAVDLARGGVELRLAGDIGQVRAIEAANSSPAPPR
ncbi:hypothetical protein [Actinoplanes sp. NPDC048796]|uniref:hypothetical protein n=1 Tax=Actinoplanes sp. NPDC048796 TaxID=3155640 RepID=UPI003409801A